MAWVHTVVLWLHRPVLIIKSLELVLLVVRLCERRSTRTVSFVDFRRLQWFEIRGSTVLVVVMVTVPLVSLVALSRLQWSVALILILVLVLFRDARICELLHERLDALVIATVLSRPKIFVHSHTVVRPGLVVDLLVVVGTHRYVRVLLEQMLLLGLLSCIERLNFLFENDWKC